MSIQVPAVRVIGDEFELYGEMDAYSSLIMTEGYDEPGSFEIKAPISEKALKMVAPGRYILAGGFCGMIERIRLSSDETGQVITISGAEAGGILRYRICIPPEGQSHWVHTGAPGACMAELINAQAISPADSARALKIAQGAIEMGTGETSVQARYDVLSDKISEIAHSAGLGWKIAPDLDALKWRFTVYAGRDLSVNQAENSPDMPVIFSPQFDNMAAASYEWATADTYNAAIIAGQGEGAERAVQAVYTQEGLSGAKLRETFVDARDLDTDAGLIARGQNKLKRCAEVNAFEGSAAQSMADRYGQKWRLGDIVTLRHDEWGVQMDARIMEVTRSYSEAGAALTITFGDAPVTLTGRLKRMMDKGNN